MRKQFCYLVVTVVLWLASYFNQTISPPDSSPDQSAQPPRTTTEPTSEVTDFNSANIPTQTSPPGAAVSSPRIELLTPAGEKASYPNLVYRALYLPNDPYRQQWYTDRIAAPAAWDKTVGSTATTVAVIDTGFALNHDELFDRWKINTGEVGGGKESNGIDDDSNGYIDDWRGWDFYGGDNHPGAGGANPNSQVAYHGTAVAGLVGAAGNNSLGVASLNWQTRLMPLQALDDDGTGYTSTVAQAMRYAVNNGANVISMSLGTSSADAALQTEINYALSHNVLVVAAAGNDGCDCMVFPANFPEVLSVGATDQNDQVAGFSSYGNNLDVVAPGTGSLLSPTWQASNQQNGYATTLHGTSFATPIVSGLAAILKGLDGSATAATITSLIKNQSDNVGAHAGAGRINAHKAVLAAQPNLPTSLPLAFIPVYRLYKAGAGTEFTTSPDRLQTYLNLSPGYQYNIAKFVSP